MCSTRSVRNHQSNTLSVILCLHLFNIWFLHFIWYYCLTNRINRLSAIPCKLFLVAVSSIKFPISTASFANSYNPLPYPFLLNSTIILCSIMEAFMVQTMISLHHVVQGFESKFHRETNTAKALSKCLSISFCHCAKFFSFLFTTFSIELTKLPIWDKFRPPGNNTNFFIAR